MTALPIVETQRGNISAYIPTNLISITDGQIALDSDLFNSDIRPAVNIGESVSRVGGAAQTAAMNTVAGRLRLELSQYEEVARFARFGAEVDEATRRQIRRGERVRAALTQPPNAPIPLAEQIIILLAATEGYLDEVPREKVNAFEQALREHVGHTHPGILQHTGRTGELTDESQETLIETIADFYSDWLALSAATLDAVMEEA